MTKSREYWKEIEGYEGIYEISNCGRVKSYHRGGAKIRKNTLTNRGYYSVQLTRNKIAKAASVHILIACAFISNPFNKPFINHINGIKTDNRISNLEWVTNKENCVHAAKMGLTCRGGKRHNSKVNELQVRIIRNLSGEIPHEEIGGIFGIKANTVSQIINRVNWVWLAPKPLTLKL